MLRAVTWLLDTAANAHRACAKADSRGQTCDRMMQTERATHTFLAPSAAVHSQVLICASARGSAMQNSSFEVVVRQW